MTRVEHLKFCSICIHQKDDMRKGIICRLTGQIADFEDQCSSFTEDTEIINQFKLKEIEDQVIDKMASQGKRFLNYLLDIFFILIIFSVFSFIIGIVLALVDPSIVSNLGEDNTMLLLFRYLLNFILTMIYYIIFETTGRSIAKYITKTRVVTEIGEKPTFNMILVRSLCRFIPFEPFSFLFNDGDGWHDTISKTKVINI